MTKTSLLALAIIVASGTHRAQAGPITFLTALPVAQGQAVVRGQYLLIRATEDPTPADRELTVHGVPLAIAVGATPRLAIFGIVPIARKDTTIGSRSGSRTARSRRWSDAPVASVPVRSIIPPASR